VDCRGLNVELEKREDEMFTRVLEMKAKRGQGRALCTAIEKKGLPIVAKYAGFVDGICLLSEETPESVIAMSFWQTKEAAEKYRKEDYPAVAEIYMPFLEGGIQLRGFEVTSAMTYKVKAA
jgi:heme-degrading monooxygenase HmoA